MYDVQYVHCTLYIIHYRKTVNPSVVSDIMKFKRFCRNNHTWPSNILCSYRQSSIVIVKQTVPLLWWLVYRALGKS